MVGRRAIALAVAAAVLAVSAPAMAGKSKHYYGRYHYGHHGYHRHHHNNDAYWIGAALIGGLVLGHLLTRAAEPPPRRYVRRVRPVLGDCRPTTGVGYRNGRKAEFGGTICYDSVRRGYITPGSVYFIRYLR